MYTPRQREIQSFQREVITYFAFCVHRGVLGGAGVALGKMAGPLAHDAALAYTGNVEPDAAHDPPWGQKNQEVPDDPEP